MSTKPYSEKAAEQASTWPATPSAGETKGHFVADPIDDEMDEPRSEDGLRVSEAIYWAQYYEHPYFSYEWNNGVLEEKPVSDALAYTMYDWFSFILRLFLETHPIAQKMALETAFRLKLPTKVTIRKPDLFIVRHDNPIALADTDRSYKGICDLCVESISDSTKREIERDTVHKKSEYEVVGVHEYYILDAKGVHTAFYQRTPAGVYRAIDTDIEGIIRSTILPGFQFRSADLYRRPALLELVADPVYNNFALPAYQAERQRAEQAEVRAEQAEARAERLAARLRALGIDDEAF